MASGLFKSYLYRGTKPVPMASRAAAPSTPPASAPPTSASSPPQTSPPPAASGDQQQRLTTIMESNNVPAEPAQQQQQQQQLSSSGLTNLPYERRMQLGTPPRLSEEGSPPDYTAEADVEANPEKPGGLKDKMKQRGGWKRLACVVGIILIALIALAVGLGVGMSDDDDESSNDGGSGGRNGGSSQPSQQPFPLGSWTFNTFLTTTSTACASNANTWSCFGGITYPSGTSPNPASVPFNWIISRSPDNPSQYMLATSDNPFSITFDSTPLHLRAEGTHDEHYAFTLPPTVKTVWPPVSLTHDNTRTICFFNSTTLTGRLYTRKAPTLKQSATAHGGGGAFVVWQHAVLVEELAHGGSDVPNCYSTWNAQATGDPIELPSEPKSKECLCRYGNYL